MKILRPWMTKPLAWLGVGLARPWLASLHYECHPLGPPVEPLIPGLNRHFIYAFWHENMLVPAYQYGPSGAQVMISKSADGLLIANICRCFGLQAVHGSSSRRHRTSGRMRDRGGAQAVLQLVRDAGKNHIVITPDGPLGPRRVVQPGAIYLAAKTGLPLVAVAFAYQRSWRINSWDRFVVPVPFSRVVGVTGVPLTVPAQLERDHIEEFRKEFERQMQGADAVAESLLRESRSKAA